MIIFASLLLFLGSIVLVLPIFIKEYEKFKDETRAKLYRKISERPNVIITTNHINNAGHHIESKRILSVAERIRNGER